MRSGAETATTPLEAARGSRASRQRALLFGTPREVLARISAGDPLEVRARVAAHLAEAHLLLDADRLHLRALAHCARRALQLRASDGLDAFISARVADAADELLREDREPQRNGRHETGGVAELARPLGFDPGRARLACSRFNRAEEADRRACFELLVRGTDLDQLARAERVSATEVARRARRALEAALGALEQGERFGGVESGKSSSAIRAKGKVQS